MSLEQKLSAILERYVSSINARILLDKAMRASKLSSGRLEMRNIGVLIKTLTPSLRLFLDSRSAAEAISALRQLGAPADEPQSVRVEVVKEEDIQAARQAARKLCGQVSANSFASTRVLTVVSELARNIVSYSRGGWVILAIQTDGLAVTAGDTGPGIPNLDEILSGNYISKSGLGLGLVGVKKLTRDFSIETGENGTTVQCTVPL